MNRQEFLETLNTQLSGEIDPREAEDNIRYYDDYIRDAVRNGMEETQVIDGIGSPFLIARTIIDTSKANGNIYHSQGSDTSSYNGDNPQNESGQGREFNGSFVSKNSKWVIIFVVAVVIILLLSLIGSLIAFVARFFIPILVIVLIAALVRGRGRR